MRQKCDDASRRIAESKSCGRRSRVRIRHFPSCPSTPTMQFDTTMADIGPSHGPSWAAPSAAAVAAAVSPSRRSTLRSAKRPRSPSPVASQQPTNASLNSLHLSPSTLLTLYMSTEKGYVRAKPASTCQLWRARRAACSYPLTQHQVI